MGGKTKKSHAHPALQKLKAIKEDTAAIKLDTAALKTTTDAIKTTTESLEDKVDKIGRFQRGEVAELAGNLNTDAKIRMNQKQITDLQAQNRELRAVKIIEKERGLPQLDAISIARNEATMEAEAHRILREEEKKAKLAEKEKKRLEMEVTPPPRKRRASKGAEPADEPGVVNVDKFKKPRPSIKATQQTLDAHMVKKEKD